MGKLHVIDEALANTAKHRKRIRFHAFGERMAKIAGRFILTNEASANLGAIVKKTQDLMLQQHQFAIQPVLPATYLELNIRKFHEALGAPTTGSLSCFGTLPDERVGYLLVDNLILGYSSDQTGGAAPTPWAIRKIDGPLAHGYVHVTLPIAFSPMGYSAEELAANPAGIIQETMEWNRLAMLLGSSLHHMPDEETRQAYLNQWAIEPVYYGLDYRDPKLLLCGAGELRTVHAMLLALNQPQLIQLTSVARAVGLSRGKRLVYAGHSVVNIELGKRKQYRRLFVGGTHASPRRHRVRGHFAHYNVIKGCIHEWPAVPDYLVPPRWFCRKCNTLRVWRKSYARGDASKGFVTNEYKVA